MTVAPPPGEGVFVDGHVHIYPEYRLGGFLAAALARARSLGGPLVLFLVETEDHDYFEQLARSTPVREGAGEATVRATAEPGSLRVEAVDRSGSPVFLVAGRQVVTRERLEVLLVGAGAATVAGGRAATTEQVVRDGLAADAITIVPWGFGKWLGRRGRLVARLAAIPEIGGHPRFFVGDILARCRPWPTPAAFHLARVLPGTDVLPLPGFERRVGCYGFRVPGALDLARPMTHLRSVLESRSAPPSFGRPDPLLHVLAAQLRYRLRGRGRS